MHTPAFILLRARRRDKDLSAVPRYETTPFIYIFFPDEFRCFEVGEFFVLWRRASNVLSFVQLHSSLYSIILFSALVGYDV